MCNKNKLTSHELFLNAVLCYPCQLEMCNAYAKSTIKSMTLKKFLEFHPSLHVIKKILRGHNKITSNFDAQDRFFRVSFNKYTVYDEIYKAMVKYVTLELCERNSCKFVVLLFRE